MKKLFSRVAIGCGILAGAVAGCAHRDEPKAAALEQGTLQMALETVSESGKVYRLRQAIFPVDSISGERAVVLRSDDDLSRPVLEAFLSPGSFRITLETGWFIEQVDQLAGTAAAVAADLVSDSVRSFDIESQQETLVQFAFDVNGERVTFPAPGRLIVGVGITEREGGAPPAGLDPRRSLIETRKDVVSAFSLEQALTASQVNAGLSPDPVLLYHELIDSYASAANGRLASAIHCGDELTNGAPSLNGYPLRCDRAERFQFDNLGRWFPTAVVNRLDLAPVDGAHCGQQRVIFANNANGRMFVIFEAQIPNPHPECGLDACRPLADFWANMSSVSDPTVRRDKLLAAFTTGVPELLAAGFGPFLSVTNLSVGTGSIRTNNFDDGQWTLRQFRLLSDPLGQTRVIPFPVSDAPHGALWDDTASFPAGAHCRQSFEDAVPQLLSDNPAEMGFVVDGECLDAESPNDDTTQNYPFHLGNGSGTFRNRLEARLVGTGLTPEDIATRARFAGSCIGCHEEAAGVGLGRGVRSPVSNGFVHVDEQNLETCGGAPCFTVSPALKQVFLPRRLTALNALLGGARTCGVVSPPGDGGVSPAPSADSGTPLPGPVTPAADAGAPPPNTVLMPDESMSDLLKEQQAALDALGGQTLGGQSAQVTH
ncbi:MAG TPA: hypothetical protein VF395_10460 [Polyangiaceae bacterium]